MSSTIGRFPIILKQLSYEIAIAVEKLWDENVSVCMIRLQ